MIERSLLALWQVELYGVMAMSTLLVRSELLAFVQNHFAKYPKQSLIQTIVNFYREDEVIAAKSLLYEFVNQMSYDA